MNHSTTTVTPLPIPIRFTESLPFYLQQTIKLNAISNVLKWIQLTNQEQAFSYEILTPNRPRVTNQGQFPCKCHSYALNDGLNRFTAPMFFFRLDCFRITADVEGSQNEPISRNTKMSLFTLFCLFIGGLKCNLCLCSVVFNASSSPS